MVNEYPIEIFQIHDVQFVGVVPVPYATCTHPTPLPSVAQIVHKFTQVILVAGSSKLIVKLHPVGAVVSSNIDFARFALIVDQTLHLI